MSRTVSSVLPGISDAGGVQVGSTWVMVHMRWYHISKAPRSSPAALVPGCQEAPRECWISGEPKAGKVGFFTFATLQLLKRQVPCECNVSEQTHESIEDSPCKRPVEVKPNTIALGLCSLVCEFSFVKLLSNVIYIRV
jgi:hypothetical protein